MAESEYCFLDTNINKLIEDIQEKGGVLDNELLNKLKYCNFEAILMKRGKYNYFQFFEQ